MIYVGLFPLLLAITFFFVKSTQVSRETFLLYTFDHSYFEFSFSIIRSPLARYARAKYVSSSILLDLFFDDYSDGRRSTKSNRGDHLDSFLVLLISSLF